MCVDRTCGNWCHHALSRASEEDQDATLRGWPWLGTSDGWSSGTIPGTGKYVVLNDKYGLIFLRMQERRIIIFSTVRGHEGVSQLSSMDLPTERCHLNGKSCLCHSYSCLFLTHTHICFLTVALTRPQALLIVIGDPCVLGMDLMWRAFLNFVHSRGTCTGKPFNWNHEEVVTPPGYEEVRLQGQAIIRGEEFVDGSRSSIFKRQES